MPSCQASRFPFLFSVSSINSGLICALVPEQKSMRELLSPQEMLFGAIFVGASDE
jgi:hypothetical protein